MAIRIVDANDNEILVVEGNEIYLTKDWSAFYGHCGKPSMIVDDDIIYLKKDWQRYGVCGDPIAIVRGNKVWSYDDRNGRPIAKISGNGVVWQLKKNSWDSDTPIATTHDREIMSGAAAAVFLIILDGEMPSEETEDDD